MRIAALLPAVLLAAAPARVQHQPMKTIGMYVHQHWPYHHPYAARTWTVDDWRAYAGGLKALGFNTIMIWPVLETMPEPLSPSDRASLEKHRQVIDMLHRMGMRAWIALCPNVSAKNQEAARAPFHQRHFFYCDRRVDPADPAALQDFMRWREKLLQPLGKADAVAVIDSDPGGYPGSTNAQFVHLLAEHRRMLDRIRPGIELIYWMHAGWEAYGRYYQSGRLVLGDDAEHLDCLRRLKELNPEPWGVANGLQYAQQLGFPERVVSFNYGRIEGEPSFPVTNFGGTTAHEGGRSLAPRGVMGNAQTHCVQLPNTFAFARGAQNLPCTDADYLRFADDLIPGQGRLILEAWKRLAGADSEAMRSAAALLERAARQNPSGGPLKGLLFNDPSRFLVDLVHMLRYRAALEDLVRAHAAATRDGERAAEGSSPPNPMAAAARAFLQAAESWQKRHGYKNMWWEPRIHPALRSLNHPGLNAVLDITYDVKAAPLAAGNAYEQVARNLADIETYTPRLLAALREALRESHANR